MTAPDLARLEAALDDMRVIGECSQERYVEALNSILAAAPSLLAADRAVERVRAMHYLVNTVTAAKCHECWRAWPCPTVAALDGER